MGWFRLKMNSVIGYILTKPKRSELILNERKESEAEYKSEKQAEFKAESDSQAVSEAAE